jgi:hypothetical protein
MDHRLTQLPVRWGRDGDWEFRSVIDGTEQVRFAGSFDDYPPTALIERVVGPHSRRKQWCIVRRHKNLRSARAMYPKKLAGPFPTLDGAKAALLVMRASGALDKM